MDHESDLDLRNRQRYHTLIQFSLQCLIALFIFLVLKVYNPEFEKPVYFLLKFSLSIGLFLVYLFEALWLYE